jgi:hypothetical protein
MSWAADILVWELAAWKAGGRKAYVGTLLRSFISFYHQAYRAAVWRSRHHYRDISGW